uniref:aminotransferase class V-fold PLP-dependent enzyme n=1 Tax=Dialister sp. TaxID=1955814 RepID=UPI00402838DE
HRLDLKGIEVSTGSACNSEKSEVSYVLMSIGLDKAYALGTIRISLGRYNTTEEAEAIARVLVQICKERV